MNPKFLPIIILQGDFAILSNANNATQKLSPLSLKSGQLLKLPSRTESRIPGQVFSERRQRSCYEKNVADLVL